jgi:hypothetical protein
MMMGAASPLFMFVFLLARIRIVGAGLGVVHGFRIHRAERLIGT